MFSSILGLAGEPITVALLGGSVSAGRDVYFKRQSDAFFGQLTAWINETFPNANHKFHNGAMAATGSTFFSVCTQTRVKYADLDIVLLEFDINDSNPSGAKHPCTGQLDQACYGNDP
jgi:hypothetical protein